MRAIDRFERFGTPLHNGQDYLKNHIFERYPIVYSMDQVADCNSEYAWVVDPEIKVYDSFPWYFRPVDSQPAIHAFPYVYRKNVILYWSTCNNVMFFFINVNTMYIKAKNVLIFFILEKTSNKLTDLQKNLESYK